jgi:lactoylglutathione lyase
MRFHHYAIEVKDMEASLRFYQTYLGFQIEQKLLFMGKEIIFLTLGECRLELYPHQGEVSQNQAIHLCFEVNNLSDIVQDVPVLEGPYQLENGWETVFVEGPNHEVLEFLQFNLK